MPYSRSYGVEVAIGLLLLIVFGALSGCMATRSAPDLVEPSYSIRQAQPHLSAEDIWDNTPHLAQAK